MDTQLPQSERMWQVLERMAAAIWVLVILLVTLLALRGSVSAETIGLALIIPPLVAALSGRAVALGMAVICAVLYNVLFIPPYYSLTIDTSAGVTALVVYTVVALAVAVIAGRLRQARDHEERRVRRREELLTIAVRLLRGEDAAVVLGDRVAPLAEAVGVPLRIETRPDGVVACIPQSATDVDQTATLEELARLIAAGTDAPADDPGPAESVFWDVG